MKALIAIIHQRHVRSPERQRETERARAPQLRILRSRQGRRPDPRDTNAKGVLKQYVKSSQPPAIIFHGEEDRVVPYASVQAFTATMKKAGNHCELVGYEGVGNIFFNQDKYDMLTIAETDKFLTGLGWLRET